MISDYDRLLAACAAHPDEDTPRLMLADEVQDTDPARAELIRVQCELARHQHGSAVRGRSYDARDGVDAEWDRAFWLFDRETALIAANEARWRKGPTCPTCKGKGAHNISDWVPPGSAFCDRCHGTGDAGGLLRVWTFAERHDAGLLRGADRWASPVRFDRGFITRVEVPAMMTLLRTTGGMPAGEYRPSHWLRAVLTATPERALIRWVVPLDREPNDWFNTLPEFLLHLTDESYPTRDAAVTALGRAVVAWARDHIAREVRA